MMKSLKHYCLLVVLLIIQTQSVFLIAQPPRVDAYFNNDLVLIGDHITLTLEAAYSEGTVVQTPIVDDKMLKGLEIISIGKVDSIFDNGNITTRQKITLTTFNEGSFQIPQFDFNYTSGKSGRKNLVKTQPLTLTVQMPEVDVEKDAPKDIKPILEVPKTWRDYVPMLLGLLLLLLVLLFIRWIYRRFFAKKTTPQEVYVAPLPPHEIAINKLKKLESAQYWQQGDIKKYYSELTEILREYLEGRYDVQALEMTTNEIINGLGHTQLDKSQIKKLGKLFHVADLVKFAKAQPRVDHHTKFFRFADEFIRTTKRKVVLEDATQNEAELVK